MPYINKGARILVVEDDAQLVRLVELTMKKEGYIVGVAGSGEQALDALLDSSPALVLLDIGLPGMDGFTTCERIREFSEVPIIMVTGKDGDEDKVRALEIGADDYLSKPFSVNVLAARVKVVLRRSSLGGQLRERVIQAGGLAIDFGRNRVTLADQEVFLSDIEYRLLTYLARNAGRIITSDQILEKIWGEEYLGEAHLLHVTIGRLRQKLGDDGRKPRYIITRRGIGYGFSVDEVQASPQHAARGD